MIAPGQLPVPLSVESTRRSATVQTGGDSVPPNTVLRGDPGLSGKHPWEKLRVVQGSQSHWFPGNFARGSQEGARGGRAVWATIQTPCKSQVARGPGPDHPTEWEVSCKRGLRREQVAAQTHLLGHGDRATGTNDGSVLSVPFPCVFRQE